MKLVQFALKLKSGSTYSKRVGIELQNEILDLTGSLQINSAMEFIQAGPSLMEKVHRLASNSEFKVSTNDVELLAPINGPDKVICIGMNYKDHCEEQGAPIPKEPVVFNKFPSTIVGPFDNLPYPEISKELDWEVELVIVIGKSGFNIPENKAADHIFGYTVAHDVSARDWQLRRNGGQWLLGKSMNAFCPIGPCITTSDEIGNPHNLDLKCSVNGVTKQNSNTKQLVFNCHQIVAWCSQFCTLLPGDLILTGTPPGVGCFMKPPQFLKKGDVVECTIEKIGTIKNEVV